MAKTQDFIAEQIETVNKMEKKARRKGFKPLFVIVPTTALTVATAVFFVVRRIRSHKEA